MQPTILDAVYEDLTIALIVVVIVAVSIVMQCLVNRHSRAKASSRTPRKPLR